MIRYLVANGLWTLSNAVAWRRHRQACRDPRRAQEAALDAFLRRNADTEYGRRWGYARLHSVREFQEAVPIVTYDDLEPWIERIRLGHPRVLTAEPVLMMEKTSGSSGASKYVPYTESLRNEFRSAVGAWMFDLFTKRPRLLGGAQYWSISPAARGREVTPGGLPVGFDDDTEYLGTLERELIGWVMPVPARVARLPDMDECRRTTLEYLMRCRGLRFISVWNPSFLTLLMDRLPAGTEPCELWPDLQVISCWTGGASARFLPELRGLFPGVEIQGKGLLATEGVISFPEIGRPASSLAIAGHFMEFIDGEGRARLVDELEVGGRYSVVITTGGGFARYALGDRVEVIAPGCIECVGRSSDVSDVCGEKLSEAFVGPILEEASRQFGVSGFSMVAPEWGRPPRYLLFMEAESAPAVAEFVEARLRTAVHYDYCRKLGQLGPLEGVSVRRAAERFLDGCERLGQRPGGVKPSYLRREFGWRERLEAQHADV